MGPHERGPFPDWEGPSPEEQRATFETVYARFAIGEVTRRGDDGTETTVRAYELIVDASDRAERRGLLVAFTLAAIQAGYKQTLPPVVLPEIGYKDTDGKRPLTAVYFFLNAPKTTPSGS